MPADADLVVIGNALSRGNPEVEVVLERRQRFTSLPALLAEEFLRPRQSLVVAGTHGKTTTTSLLAFLLQRAGLDPSFLIGGVPVDFERSYRLGGGPHFVIEGDEYDCAFFDKRPKFVHYLPSVAIIGNVEYDHADIYPDLAAVQLAFVRLMQVVPRSGLLIAGSESPALAEILKHARCRVLRRSACRPGRTGAPSTCAPGARGYALPADARRAGTRASSRCRWRASTTCATRSRPWPRPPKPASALDVARAALPAFRGVKRRLELRGEAAGVRVYDDFAHHPTAVAATLAALRSAGGDGRLVAVFEPRSYTSRTRIFQDDFARAFAGRRPRGRRRGTPAGQGARGRAHLGDRAGRGHPCRRRRRVFVPAVDAIVAHLAPDAASGRSRGDPLERGLRRDPRQAAAGPRERWRASSARAVPDTRPVL